MGGKAEGSKLVACQMYHAGWLKDKDVALYDRGVEPMTYMVGPLYGESKYDEAVKSVMIPRDNGRDIFLSRSKAKQGQFNALHLRNEGGSSRVKAFKKATEYDGLRFEEVGRDGNTYLMQISEISSNPSNPSPSI